MFHVRHPYQSQTGQIKLSHASGKAVFQNVTEGLALKYVVQGHELYLIQGEYVPLSAGQFMLLNVDEPYQAMTQSVSTLTQGICVDLDPHFVAAQVPNLMEEDWWFHTPIQARHYLKLPLTLAELGQRNLRSDGEAVFHLLRQELEDLIQYVSPLQYPLQSLAKKSHTQKTLLSKLLIAKDYLSQYYRQSISLQQLAAKASISPSHLHRSFQSCFGLTP
ncbi:MAG: hypothetical protein AAFR59_18350, partial [Bacteroidota bacterium]